ncbi:MAG: TadE/TadG family type IV pilus assembly protein [Paracoccaceae bacterium]
MKTILKSVATFLEDNDGAISIESVLWLPVYTFFLVMIVDVSLMFNGQAQAQRVLHDINRLASTGYYTSEEEVESRANALLSHLSANVSVDATIDTASGTITAVASMPASDLMAIGTIPNFSQFNVTVGAWHLIES